MDLTYHMQTIINIRETYLNNEIFTNLALFFMKDHYMKDQWISIDTCISIH